MAIHNLDYWYDASMRRYLEQIVGAFSGFQYMTGSRNGAAPQLMTVPCTLAKTDRMVGHIMRNLSENTLLTVPMITVYQTGLTGRRDDVQYPGFVDTLQVTERAIDPSGRYTGEKGNSYSVQRLMPRPFLMTVQVDLWTSNLDQKHQLAEQILTIIYPTFDIQNSSNALDWTALTTISVEDISWTSRSIPVGTESDIDIMTITLNVPIWLSPPAKVKQQKIIQAIVTNIFEGGRGGADGRMMKKALLAQHVTTPHNHRLLVDGDVLTLLNGHGGETGEDGEPLSWKRLFEEYGLFVPGQSRIALNGTEDIEAEDLITGLITLDAAAPNKLRWQIDPETLPANTLPAVDAIIDPVRTAPGSGLPAPVEGIRYLLVGDVAPSLAWGQFSAREHDIIEYREGQWTVAFKSAEVAEPQFVLNRNKGRQLRWNGREWLLSIDGEYGPGFWKLMLAANPAS